MNQEEWIAQLEFLAKTSTELTMDLLWAFGQIMSRANFSYSHSSFIGNPFGPEILAEIKEAKLRREIRERARYLRRKRYIKHQQEGNQIITKMTKEGEVRALERQIHRTQRVLPEGEYTVVVFDIPEDIKSIRKCLRVRLRSFGFDQHQRSVWVCSRDVSFEVLQYVKLIGVGHWVSVFQGQQFI